MPLSSSRTPAMRIKDTTYPAGAEHIGQVRADLQGLLDDCPAADDVILCASELATNAVVHSDSRKPGGKFTVRAEVIPRRYARMTATIVLGPYGHASTGHDQPPMAPQRGAGCVYRGDDQA